jgi:hypothetical protein
MKILKSLIFSTAYAAWEDKWAKLVSVNHKIFEHSPRQFQLI